MWKSIYGYWLYIKETYNVKQVKYSYCIIFTVFVIVKISAIFTPQGLGFQELFLLFQLINFIYFVCSIFKELLDSLTSPPRLSVYKSNLQHS